MNWQGEMAVAYEAGLADGKAGLRRGRPNDFEACYQQGYEHGKAQRLQAQSDAYSRAHEAMREHLNAK